MVGETKYAYEACNRCMGQGFGENETCTVCYGRGKVLVKQPARECTTCLGTGYYCDLGSGAYHGTCKVCGGSGWLGTVYPMKA